MSCRRLRCALECARRLVAMAWRSHAGGLRRVALAAPVMASLAAVLLLERLGSRGAARAAPGGAACPEPICDDRKRLFAAAMGGGGARGGASAGAARAGAGASVGAVGVPVAPTQAAQAAPAEDCPLTRSELGRATWELLHSTAAYLPEQPSEEQRRAAEALVRALGVVYACAHCREHFAAHLARHPVDASSRRAYSKWVCDAHNAVNHALGKPLFECSEEALQRRWRTGCREPDADESASESLGQS